MQDFILECPLSASFDTPEDTNSEQEESDEDIDEYCAKEFPEAEHTCGKLIAKDAYILSVSATRSLHPNVAVALSNDRVETFRFDRDFEVLCSLDQKSDKTVDLKFSKDNDNLLWTGTNNGTIKLWDLRSPENAVSTFTDTTDEKLEKDRKFNCFDISANGRLLCAGTDTFEGDSFLLFWDIRNSKLVGGFWESHVEDITQVKFHPTDSNKMLSGSTDGLINIYDLTQSCEDDALIDSLNTESSIEKLSWSEVRTRDVISCITHTADVQLWKTEDAQPYCNFSRADIARSLKRKSENYAYVVDVYVADKIIIAGSNVQNGECARGLKLEESCLKPAFGLVVNEQRIRCSVYNENSRLLLTGGEKGILDGWKVGI